MAIWNSNNCIVTTLGLQMLAQLQQGVGTATITRAKVGTGRTSSISSATSLSGDIHDISILSRRITNTGSVLVLQLSNEGLNTSYLVNQVGIYATHPQINNGAEFLYMIAQCDEDSADIVPNSEVTLVTLNYSFYLTHSTGADITVSVISAGAIPYSEKGNSNGVATLDGGGKIPKAQIPDITPTDVGCIPTTGDASNAKVTYTRASTLTNLVSGEKFSTAFGKISKAVATLISHIADTNNPHSVTKEQLGLFNTSNNNILDNPWFTVNQRAIASGNITPSSDYVVDRWKFNVTSTGSSNGSFLVNSSGLKLTPPTGGSWSINQPISELEYKILNGKKITASVMLSSGTIYKGTITRSESTKQDIITDSGITVSMTATNSLLITGTSEKIIRAVKLELGEYSTLNLDTYPNWGLEVVKCSTNKADQYDSYANKVINIGAILSSTTE